MLFPDPLSFSMSRTIFRRFFLCKLKNEKRVRFQLRTALLFTLREIRSEKLIRKVCNVEVKRKSRQVHTVGARSCEIENETRVVLLHHTCRPTNFIACVFIKPSFFESRAHMHTPTILCYSILIPLYLRFIFASLTPYRQSLIKYSRFIDSTKFLSRFVNVL